MPRKNWKQADAAERIHRIIPLLKQQYEAECALTFKTPFQLLIATILSAQCTDERVNKVTPDLFKRYPTAKKMALASQEDIEESIRSTGFYRNKAKSLLAVSDAIANQHNNRVPEDMDALIALPGIGRKTANVVLGTAYGHPAITVDTHVKRLSKRLDLAKKNDPDRIEMELKAIVPDDEQTGFSHRLIWHGRKVCDARKPRCEDCVLAPYCPSEGKA